MGGCCPTDAAVSLASTPAAPSGDLDLAVREIAPGVGFLQLIAPGMHCGGCVASLEKGLRAVPGVRAARANLTAKRLAVEFDLGSARAADIAAAAERLGFPVHPLDAAEAAEEAEKRETRDLLTRLGVAGFAAMNIMLLSVSVWSGADAATRDLMHWISALIALPTVIYSGRPFYVSAHRRAARGTAEHGRADLARGHPRRRAVAVRDAARRAGGVLRRRRRRCCSCCWSGAISTA
jgi:Cu2+-exporting ATPase